MALPANYEQIIRRGMQISNELLNLCREARDNAKIEILKVASGDPAKGQKIMQTALKVAFQPIMTPIQRIGNQIDYVAAQKLGIAVTVDTLVGAALGISLIVNPLLQELLFAAIDVYKTQLAAKQEMEETTVEMMEFEV